MRPPQLTIFVAHPSPYMTDSKPHGDGLIAFSFLRELADARHTIHVATPLYEIKSELPDNVILHHIQMRAQPSDDKQSLAFRLEYAVRVRLLFSQLRRSIAFDVIHQMNPVVLGLSSLLYGLGTPVLLGPFWSPWEATEGQHLSKMSILRSRLREFMLARAIRRADGVLAPNRLTAKLLVRAGMNPRLIFSLPIGVDTNQFFPAPSLTPAKPTILFLAGLWKRKGVYTLLAAFEILADRMPDAELLIAGSGEEQVAIEERVRAMPGGERIQMLGPIRREAVCETMQRCSVYCLPSYGEPFGLSALEAMSCGKPLVVTDAGGLGELVKPEGGRKVKPGDAAGLAAALQFVLEKPGLASEMGEFNRRHVMECYSWAAVSSTLARVYAVLQVRCENEDERMIELEASPESSL
jgi:glycosyltransferase involved in cell wall biosynthesis